MRALFCRCIPFQPNQYLNQPFSSTQPCLRLHVPSHAFVPNCIHTIPVYQPAWVPEIPFNEIHQAWKVEPNHWEPVIEDTLFHALEDSNGINDEQAARPRHLHVVDAIQIWIGDCTTGRPFSPGTSIKRALSTNLVATIGIFTKVLAVDIHSRAKQYIYLLSTVPLRSLVTKFLSVLSDEAPPASGVYFDSLI